MSWKFMLQVPIRFYSILYIVRNLNISSVSNGITEIIRFDGFRMCTVKSYYLHPRPESLVLPSQRRNDAGQTQSTYRGLTIIIRADIGALLR